MNLLELGCLLKSEREKRGLSVRDVMEATKISRRNLNALEDGETKLLPHPVYLKGYVRNYAQLVGLQPEPLVAVVEQQSDGDSGYLTQLAPVAPAAAPVAVQPVAQPEPAPAVEEGASAPESVASGEAPAPTVSAPVAADAEPASSQIEAAPQAVQEPAAQEPAPQEQPGAFASQIRYPKSPDLTPRPRRRVWPWVLLLLFFGIMAALYVQYQRIQAEVDQTPPAAAPVPADNATNATNATIDLNATLPDEANASLPGSMPEVAPESSAAAAPAPSGQSAPAAKPLPPQSATPAVSASPVEVSRKAQSAAQPVAASAANTPGAEMHTPGMQQLVITAKQNEACWVEVSEGAQRKSFILKNGETRRIEFLSKAKVRLGNAGGVSFKVNGAPYPFEGERGATATLEIGAR